MGRPPLNLRQGRAGWRAWLAFTHDVVAAALAWSGLFWARFGSDVVERYGTDLLASLALVVPLQAFIFVAFSLYRGLWRFASLPDLKRIIVAAALGALLIPLAVVMLRLDVVIPRSVLVLYPVLLVAIMAGSRFAYRLWKEHRLYSPLAALGEPVLVLGAGEAGALLTKELERSREWRVVGLLDDDPAKKGRMLRNVQVLGPIDQVGIWAARFGVRHVIIAMPSADHSARRRTAEACVEAGLQALTVPAYQDLISGRAPLSTVRQIELDDLLGRDPVVLDSAGLREWLGRHVVMVTGAGGSIGTELCRQIARFEPDELVLFDVSEYALYRIAQQLADEFPRLKTAALVGDVKNPLRVREVLESFRPSVIFHAAAYKHVPMMEEHNAWEAVRNNAYGTLVVAREAAACGVGKLVLVSTDKAVNPTNVMGASKRLAELVCQGVANGSTQFVIVRFGNVVGSAGSVIPRFREQIARGGPVTVTHPDITRYFMSLAEAAQLLLQAGMIGHQGEVLVLDMGEPVRIADLARDLIRLSGEDPDRIGIKYIGLRPGEKLFEEPLAASEPTRPTPHRKLRLAMASRLSPKYFADAVDWLSGGAPVGDEAVRATLARLLPEYAPYVPGASVPGVPSTPSASNASPGDAGESGSVPLETASPAAASATAGAPPVRPGPRGLPAPRPAPSAAAPVREPLGAEMLVRRVTR